MSKTVDGLPPGQVPASITMSILAFNSALMSEALTGGGSPEMFALGATIAPHNRLMMANATGCCGMRTPRLGSPAFTSSGIEGCFQ